MTTLAACADAGASEAGRAADDEQGQTARSRTVLRPDRAAGLRHLARGTVSPCSPPATTGPALPREVLRVEEVEQPEPGPGEVLVRVTRLGGQPDRLQDALRRDRRRDVPVPRAQPGRRRRRRGGRRRRRPRARGRARVALLRRLAAPVGHRGAVHGRSRPSRRCRCPTARRDDLGASLGIPAMTAHRCLFADGPIEGADRARRRRRGRGRPRGDRARPLGGRGARRSRPSAARRRAQLAREAGARRASSSTARDDAAEQLRAAAPDGVDRIVELSLVAEPRARPRRRRAARGDLVVRERGRRRRAGPRPARSWSRTSRCASSSSTRCPPEAIAAAVDGRERRRCATAR